MQWLKHLDGRTAFVSAVGFAFLAYGVLDAVHYRAHNFIWFVLVFGFFQFFVFRRLERRRLRAEEEDLHARVVARTKKKSLADKPVIGKTCKSCKRRIVVEDDGRRCKTCHAPVHHHCAKLHEAEAHAAQGAYR
jgi:hypothetical protein